MGWVQYEAVSRGLPYLSLAAAPIPPSPDPRKDARGEVLNFKSRSRMIQTVEAQIDEHGHIRLSEPLKLAHPSRALVTILNSSPKQQNETAILSEASLAVDWSREEEDKAWAHLQ